MRSWRLAAFGLPSAAAVQDLDASINRAQLHEIVQFVWNPLSAYRRVRVHQMEVQMWCVRVARIAQPRQHLINFHLLAESYFTVSLCRSRASRTVPADPLKTL